MPTVRLVTFQTWVYRHDWWQYQQANPHLIPVPLIDRSPCQDPFLDHLETAEDARPTISGLCRTWNRFETGDIFIYLARANNRVLRELGFGVAKSLRYFAVAALGVTKVHLSHRDFATTCERRPYMTAPCPTDTPPNIVTSPAMADAVAKNASVLFQDGAPLLGVNDVLGVVYRFNLRQYHRRWQTHRLQVAECRFLPRPQGWARHLTVQSARLLEPSNWANFVLADDASFNGRLFGHIVKPEKSDQLLDACFG